MKTYKTLIIFYSIFFAYIYEAFAYSPAVHEEITKKAINLNIDEINSFISGNTGLSDVRTKVNGKEIRVWLEEGSVKEDYTLDIVTSHFYNPLTDKGVSPSQSAYERASELWGFARGELYRGLTTPADAGSLYALKGGRLSLP